MQTRKTKTKIAKNGESLAACPAKLSRAQIVRARITLEKLAPHDPARDEARRARRARITPRRMARVLKFLRALGYGAGDKLRAKREGTPRAFGARFVPEFAEEFASGALGAWAHGAGRRATIRAGFSTANDILRRMSHESHGDDLLSLPVEVLENEEHEDTARLLAESRRGILLTAVELRAKARAAYDTDMRAACGLAGRQRSLAVIAARRAFRRDSRFVRRAALCVLARLYGRGFEFTPALGVSPEGKRGGKAHAVHKAWERMLLAHEATCARLGVTAPSLSARVRAARES